MCCHKIQAVKAFCLKFIASLSWVIAVLKIFAMEFNCVGNHFLDEFFRRVFLKFQKFLRNNFLVSMFLKWLLFSILQLFCLCCDKIFLICIWESIRFLGLENPFGFTVFYYFHQKLHLRSLRGQICLCMCLVPQIWRWINEISKVCYEETQKNV